MTGAAAGMPFTGDRACLDVSSRRVLRTPPRIEVAPESECDPVWQNPSTSLFVDNAEHTVLRKPEWYRREARCQTDSGATFWEFCVCKAHGWIVHDWNRGPRALVFPIY